MDERLLVGVDLGGTTVTAGVVQAAQILAAETAATRNDRTPDEIFNTIAELIAKVTRSYPLGGIGVGVPLPAGPETETLDLNFAGNLPTMQDYPLKHKLAERFRVPVVLENDARCMALGEQRAGALRGCRCGACITLGTGLGCGIIIDGKVYRGGGYYAGEIWHIPLKNGIILEEEASIRGLQRRYRQMAGVDLEPRLIYERYLAGEAGAALAWRQFGEAVGRAVVLVLCLLDPQRIAVGGGLSSAYEAFKDGMLVVVQRTCGKQVLSRIVPAELSDKAAVIGAAEAVKTVI